MIPPATDVAWLYIKGDEAVRLEVTADGPALRLAIFGPGSAFMSLDFSNRGAMSTFQEAFADELVTKGFRLHATSERRRPAAIDGYPRLVEDCRRR